MRPVIRPKDLRSLESVVYFREWIYLLKLSVNFAQWLISQTVYSLSRKSPLFGKWLRSGVKDDYKRFSDKLQGVFGLSCIFFSVEGREFKGSWSTDNGKAYSVCLRMEFVTRIRALRKELRKLRQGSRKDLPVDRAVEWLHVLDTTAKTESVVESGMEFLEEHPTKPTKDDWQRPLSVLERLMSLRLTCSVLQLRSVGAKCILCSSRSCD